MQTALLTFATAIILAVTAAFAAPFYVDWGQWRGTFETQAARAVGAPVVIRGPIEAELLPVPRLVLRDVSIGADGVGTGVSAAELRGSFSLGALIKGEVAAEQLTLVKPRIRVVLDATGKVALPTGAARPAGFSITELNIENGTLDLLDRASDRAVRFDDLDLRGEVGGPVGPIKLEGEVKHGGQRQTLKLALGAFVPDGSSKLRLSLQGLASPTAFDADGVFRLAGGQPAFEGKSSFAMRPMKQAATPLARAGWTLAGTVRAGRDLIEAQELSLTLGGAERPLELTGSGRFGAGTANAPAGNAPQARATPRLELTLSARQVDLGTVTEGASPLAVLGEIARSIEPLADIVPVGSVGLTSDTVLLGGAPVRDVRADFGWSAAGWQVKALQAKLPGRGSLRVSGRVPLSSGTPVSSLFTGDIAFEAEDLPTLANWAVPNEAALLAGLPAGSASLNAGIDVNESRVALNRLVLGMGPVRLNGNAAYVFPPADGRARIDARLAADGIDLDALIAPARRLLALGGGNLAVDLGFSGRGLRLAGIASDKVDLAVKSGADGLSIERLVIADLGGLTVTGSGRLAKADSAGDGRFEARLTGERAEGLAVLARSFGPAGSAELAGRLGPTLAPVDLSLTLNATNGRNALAAQGRLGKLSGTAKADFGGGQPLTGTLGLDIADGSDVLTRFGIPGLRTGLGPARLDATLSPGFEGQLYLAGAGLAAKGEIKPDEQGTLRPVLNLTIEKADLARLFPAIAAASDGAVPVTLAGRLTRPVDTSGERSADAWRFDNAGGTIAGVKVEGGVVYAPGKAEPIEADLKLDRWSLTRAMGLITGRAGGNGLWVDGRFNAAPFPDLAASITLAIAALDSPGGLTIERSRLRLRLAGGAAKVEEIAGTLADGRLAGSFTLRRRGEVVETDGHVSLTGADLNRLLSSVAAKPTLRGRSTLGLDLAGAGRTPVALAQSLAGQGSLAIDDFELDALDPRSLQYVMLATERGTPPDGKRLGLLVEQGLARGSLKLPRVETSLSVLNGVAKTGTARLAIGSQRFALGGSLDLARLILDGSIEMEDSADPRATAPPGVVVQWRGPLGAPARRLDAAALGAAINMRALERETKRLEAEYGRSPVMDAGHATDAPELPATTTPPPVQAAPPAATEAPPAAPKPQAQRPRPKPAPTPEAGIVPALPPPITLFPDRPIRPPAALPQ